MSTAFHPQTDGQTARLNQMIEAYLQAFVSREQDNWVSLLPIAEFAYNNSVTMENGMSPFYANYGVHLVTMNLATTRPLNQASTIYAHWMHTMHDESCKGLEAAQERMRRYPDPDHKEPPAYQVGDLVILSGCNIKTRCPSRKLDRKNHGPFQIEKIVSPLTVRLTLPRKWKIHNIFHVSLLEPYRTSEHRASPDPSKVLREADDIEQSEEYNVEEVMFSVKRGRRNNKRILYLVKWLDYPERKDWTEEPYDNFFSRWPGETLGVASMESGRTKGLPAHQKLDQIHRGPGGIGLKGWRTSVPKRCKPTKRPTSRAPTKNH